MVVTTGAKAAKEIEGMGEKFHQIDPEEFFVQMHAAYPWPLGKMLDYPFAQLQGGDFAFGARMFIRLGLLQGILVTIEMGFLLAVIGKIVENINV